jgi:hypothetical protein
MMNGNPDRYGLSQEIKAAGLQGMVDMAVGKVDQNRPGFFLKEAADEAQQFVRLFRKRSRVDENNLFGGGQEKGIRGKDIGFTQVRIDQDFRCARDGLPLSVNDRHVRHAPAGFRPWRAHARNNIPFSRSRSESRFVSVRRDPSPIGPQTAVRSCAAHR